jgi:hypothetical protein
MISSLQFIPDLIAVGVSGLYLGNIILSYDTKSSKVDRLNSTASDPFYYCRYGFSSKPEI